MYMPLHTPQYAVGKKYSFPAPTDRFANYSVNNLTIFDHEAGSGLGLGINRIYPSYVRRQVKH